MTRQIVHLRARALSRAEVAAIHVVAGVYELSNVRRRRPIEEIERRPDLFDAPFAHHDDPIGQSKCLLDVVGYEERRRGELGDDADELALQRGTYDDVDCAEGFVHQQCSRPSGDCARHADPLCLTAGERAGPARSIRHGIEADEPRSSSTRAAISRRSHPSSDGTTPTFWATLMLEKRPIA